MTRECENSFSPLEGVVGEVCRYRCNRGYVLQGAERVVCSKFTRSSKYLIPNDLIEIISKVLDKFYQVL